VYRPATDTKLLSCSVTSDLKQFSFYTFYTWQVDLEVILGLGGRSVMLINAFNGQPPGWAEVRRFTTFLQYNDKTYRVVHLHHSTCGVFLSVIDFCHSSNCCDIQLQITELSLKSHFIQESIWAFLRVWRLISGCHISAGKRPVLSHFSVTVKAARAFSTTQFRHACKEDTCYSSCSFSDISIVR